MRFLHHLVSFVTVKWKGLFVTDDMNCQRADHYKSGLQLKLFKAETSNYFES